tara:strand:- start:415 stop:675 length:261 start_codon:yes stop_codon:yes gene_type:complete
MLYNKIKLTIILIIENQKEIIMSLEKEKKIKKILILNLIIGIHNIINFALHGYLTALIIGCVNIGAWVMLRDMKLAPIIIKKITKN